MFQKRDNAIYLLFSVCVLIALTQILHGPPTKEAWEVKARVFYNQGDYENAYDAYRRLTGLDGRNTAVSREGSDRSLEKWKGAASQLLRECKYHEAADSYRLMSKYIELQRIMNNGINSVKQSVESINRQIVAVNYCN